MSESVKIAAEWAATIIELIGVGLLALLTFYVLAHAAWQLYQRDEGQRVFRDTRRRMGTSILLSLEFLVAADIVHTVAVDLSFTTVGVLAAVVAVRTFLSFTIDVEVNGRWPWQAESATGQQPNQ